MSSRYFEGVYHATLYAKFRPAAPNSLISRIISFLQEKYKGSLDFVADVGCGPGQSTRVLSTHFSNIIGLDVSKAQIDEAIKNNKSTNITFKVSGAESLPFKKETLQLVTSGQACHWFDLPKFYQEVNRILIPSGVIALYGYNFPRPSYNGKFEDELFNLMIAIYNEDTKGLWGNERIFVDNSYTDERFSIPYAECRRECFTQETNASVQDFAGYISTWSGFQKYTLVNGEKQAEKLLNQFVDNVMAVTGASTSPEETELLLRYRFFLVMGRKPPS